MSPSVTWDSDFEASPADTDEAKYGATKFRQLKVAISERGELEFNWKAGTQPFVKAGKAAVFFVGTTAEIAALSGMAVGALAWDTTLKCLKYYSGSAWTRADIIPNASKFLIYADVAPAGWTIQDALNDKLVFITKGSAAGGQTGGGVHSTGSWTISGITATQAAHGHDTEIGPWYHTTDAGIYLIPKTGTYESDEIAPAITVAHNGNWRPAAYCMIVCAKD